MRKLRIDIETFSDIDIKYGVYRYTDTPNFRILLFAYAFDDEAVQIVDLESGENLPDRVLRSIKDKRVLKSAYNAQFERVCLSRYFNQKLSADDWWCTMAHAAHLGLPGKLGHVAEALKLEEQKDKSGTILINYFSKPCKPSRANGGRTRNLPAHDTEKWELFKKYCMQDVETERAISKYLEKYPVPEKERQLYILDQKTNDLGVKIDRDLVESITEYYADHAQELIEESKEITGLENANSRNQLLEWLNSKGIEIEDIRKATLEELLENDELDPEVRRVLGNRLETGMASIKKYQMMENAVCRDEAIHGVLQYYGASRTGRYAGRLVQVQNLTKNYMKELDAVRNLVKKKEYPALESIYDSVSDIFKQLVRTAFIAREGMTYAIADYSSIEARIIAWLADEKWAMEVFSKDGDIYKQTASNMFHIPLEKIDKPLRQKGKISVLALGYGGGVGALKAMGALSMGIEEDELQGLVNAWRKANPKIKKLWYDAEALAKQVIQKGGKANLHHGVYFEYDGQFMHIGLPAGRKISYFKPRIKDGRICYRDAEKKKGAFAEIDTFGGKLVENIVQAIARDCLAEALLDLDKAGFSVVFHVHDEVIVETKSAENLSKIQTIMGAPISWAPGLYLSSAGYTSDYYMKD